MPRATVRTADRALLHFRKQLGITQEELARKAGYSKRQIERLESGANTTVTTLADVAEVLGCTSDDLIEADADSIAREIQSDFKGLLHSHMNKKRISRVMKEAVLSRLVCSPGAGASPTSITCRTASRGDINLALRQSVTIGELTHAVAREYFEEDYGEYAWALTDADGDEYDITLTLGELDRQSVNVVYLRKYKSTGMVLAMIPPETLAGRLRRLQRGGFFLKRIRCRLYSWLYSSRWLSRSAPFGWMLSELADVAGLYAEANLLTDRAIEMARLVERSPHSAAYGDTLAWVWYRAGWHRAALATLAQNAADIHVGLWTVSYHLYFICRRLGYDDAAEAIWGYFARVLEGGADILQELQWKRVRSNNDAAMP